jgi:dimethylargininase
MPLRPGQTIAITHLPSRQLEAGERTFVGRNPIDYGVSLRQHEGYREMLRRSGAQVHTLDVNRELPDSVFVEDTAIVLDEVAVMMSMGAESRRGEPPGIEAALRKFREIDRVRLPATIDGGDVVLVGRTLLVGQTARTNDQGIEAIAAAVRRYGYRVLPVRVHGALHLKSACTALPDDRLIVNAAWIDMTALNTYSIVHVPPDEPWGGDVAILGTTVFVAAEQSATAEMIRGLGFDVETTPLSEFAKAEGGVTCLSLLFSA